MRKAELLSTVRSLLPPDTTWPSERDDVRLEGGTTVLMLVARVPEPPLAVKLVDFVCTHTANFWARDAWRRHTIMDACYHGVHASVLLRLLKWARKRTVRVLGPMSRQDIDGLDAVELAIRGGHGALASCLLEQHEPSSHDDLLCKHYPLKVLELAIESGYERCALNILANKRVVHHLQPGAAVRLNLSMHWEQRRDPVKRLFNVFTCVGAAVRCGKPSIVQAIYKLNPTETRQAVWYALYKMRAQSPAGLTEIPSEVKRMARSYLLDKLWPQIRVIVVLRHWQLLAKNKPTLWERIRRLSCRGHCDWNAIAAHPWATLPNEMLTRVLSFLLPSETAEAKKIAFLVEYREE
ncbi:hypothetical protein KRP22_013618 [Phytophthora ramorum]|nr:hypothetical protein KRP22_11204 [Phytophthora ramorum]